VDAIDKLAAWLQDGPRMASVTGVDVEPVAYCERECFSIG
jgi:hypothetical protein